ncbi:MAG: hypothetical protein ACUVRO_01860 [Armatimonadota bacterium]
MNTRMMPAPDPLGLPWDPLLMKVLLLATFVVHILLVAAMLGGTVLVFFGELVGLVPSAQRWRRMAVQYGYILPFIMSLAVTFGIPPLLFMQVLYSQYLYTSSVLIAWPWILVIPSLSLGYGGLYIYQRLHDRIGRTRLLVMGTTLALFLWVAFVYVNNMTLAQAPWRWPALYTATATGFHLNLGEPILWPRYGMVVSGAVAVAGAVAAWIAGRSIRTGDREFGQWGIRVGSCICAAGLTAAGLFGWAMTVRAPEPALHRLVQMSYAPLLTRVMIALLGLAVLVFLGAAVRPTHMLLWAGSASIGVSAVLGVILRDMLRLAYLGQLYRISERPVKYQLGTLLVFAVTLLVGIGVLAWIWRLVRRGAKAVSEGARPAIEGP